MSRNYKFQNGYSILNISRNQVSKATRKDSRGSGGIKNSFKSLQITQQNLQDMLSGKFNSYQELFDSSHKNNVAKEYIIITYKVKNYELDTFTDIVDCVFINN